MSVGKGDVSDMGGPPNLTITDSHEIPPQHVSEGLTMGPSPYKDCRKARQELAIAEQESPVDLCDCPITNPFSGKPMGPI